MNRAHGKNIPLCTVRHMGGRVCFHSSLFLRCEAFHFRQCSPLGPEAVSVVTSSSLSEIKRPACSCTPPSSDSEKIHTGEMRESSSAYATGTLPWCCLHSVSDIHTSLTLLRITVETSHLKWLKLCFQHFYLAIASLWLVKMVDYANGQLELLKTQPVWPAKAGFSLNIQQGE